MQIGLSRKLLLIEARLQRSKDHQWEMASSINQSKFLTWPRQPASAAIQGPRIEGDCQLEQLDWDTKCEISAFA